MNVTGDNLRLPLRELHLIILETAVMVFITITSLLGNALLCIVIFRTNTLHRVTNYYVITLSCAGMLMASVDMPFIVSVLYNGEWVYGEFLCNLQGFTVLTLGIGTQLMIGLTAVNRYVCILKPNKYRRWFSIKSSITTIFCGWVSAIVTVAVPFALGYSNFHFNIQKATCFIRTENEIVDAIHSTFTLLIYIFSPLCAVIFCYYKVLCVVQKHKVSVGMTAKSRNQTSPRLTVEEINITYTLLAIVLGFLMCMIPVIVLEFLETFCALCMTRAAHMAYMYCGCMSSAVNPLVYGLVNRRFRKAVKRIILCKCRRTRRVSAKGQTQMDNKQNHKRI